jgi:dsDNA-binding SOS-regulon protein
MEPLDFTQIKASKKVLKLIADMQDRLLRTEDALEDIARASEIVEITGQTEMLSTWRQQADELLRDRIVRPDTSVTADQHKMVIVTDDDNTLGNKNVT